MLREKIARHVDGWIVKRDTDNAPRRIAEADIADLTDLLNAQIGRSEEEASAVLLPVFSGWIVQRARGERPSVLNVDDARVFLAFLPEADTAPSVDVVQPEEIAPSVEDAQSGGSPGGHIASIHSDDPSPAGAGEREAAHSDAMPVRPEHVRVLDATPQRPVVREMPAQYLFEGLDLARFHIEQGV